MHKDSSSSLPATPTSRLRRRRGSTEVSITGTIHISFDIHNSTYLRAIERLEDNCLQEKVHFVNTANHDYIVNL